MAEKGEFCISTCGERFHGRYETREAAIEEAVDEGAQSFWVGRCEPATPPEEYWDAEGWLENVSCQDDYGGEAAEDWDDSTPAQREELEALVRPILAEWLDRHGLRPKFYMVAEMWQYRIVDGRAELVEPVKSAGV